MGWTVIGGVTSVWYTPAGSVNVNVAVPTRFITTGVTPVEQVISLRTFTVSVANFRIVESLDVTIARTGAARPCVAPVESAGNSEMDAN